MSASASLKHRANSCYHRNVHVSHGRHHGDGLPANILLKSLESIVITTSALAGGWPCPALPAAFFRSKNQMPACSPDMDIKKKKKKSHEGHAHRMSTNGLTLSCCYLIGQTDKCPALTWQRLHWWLPWWCQTCFLLVHWGTPWLLMVVWRWGSRLKTKSDQVGRFFISGKDRRWRQSDAKTRALCR